MRCTIVAEIGINHNGSLDICRQLIATAAVAGCDYVKFQKRTLSEVYTEEELDAPRESPFGTTNRDLKERLELSYRDYRTINVMCQEHGIGWFASCWDPQAVRCINMCNPPFHKVASACLTDDSLLHAVCETGKHIILSTGMSTLDEIDHAVEVIREYGNDLTLMHCTSCYPCKDEDLNLRAIHTLRERYNLPVGYSGHELGLATTVAAVAMGACMVERHITLDRAMFGSDQAASIEPQGLMKLVRDIRAVEKAMGTGEKKVLPCEQPALKKLRKVCK